MKKLSSSALASTLSLIASALLIATAGVAHATTWDWDPSGSSSGGTDKTAGVGTTWSQSGSVSNWYKVSGGSNPTTYTGVTGDTVVFGSSSTPTAAQTVTVSKTVTAGTIVFNNYGGSNGQGAYTITGGNISGGGGALVIQATQGATGINGTFKNINLINASSYTILGASTPISTGITFSGASVAGNLVAGNGGSDFGTFQIASGNVQTTASASGTVTISNGWTLTNTNDLNVTSITQDWIINGMGNSGAGAIKANSFVTPSGGENYTGSIQVASDSAILGAAIVGSGVAGKSGYRGLYGQITGTGNLYLGYQNSGTATTLNANGISVQQLLIGSTGTASNNTGATIVFNTTAGDNASAVGGVVSEAVLDATNNGLSNATTLVLGETGSFRETGSSSVLPIGSPNSNTTGTAWKVSDGAFDLNGNSQSLQGLIVGGVGQGTGGTDILKQSNNLILNNGTGPSVLTITGTTGNAVATGFGGVIEDNQSIASGGGTANSGAGKVAIDVNGGTLMLSGQNTYSGGTSVDHGGLLEVGTSNATTGDTLEAITGTFGISTGTLNITNGTVDLESHSVTVGATTFGTGGATIKSTGGAGTLATGGVEVTSTGNTIASGATVTGGADVATSASLTVNGALDKASIEGTLNDAGSITSSALVDGGTLNFTGGTLGGPLNVNANGIVDLNHHTVTVGATTLGTGGATIQSTGGLGTLATSGVKVTGTNNTIASNASVTGGADIGTGAALTVNGSLDSVSVEGTLNDGGAITGASNVDGGTFNYGAGGSAGNLAVNAGGVVDLNAHSVTAGATTLGSGGATIQSTGGAGTLATSGVTVNGTGNAIATNASVTGGVTVTAGSSLSVAGTADSLALNAGSTGTINSGGNVTGALTVAGASGPNGAAIAHLAGTVGSADVSGTLDGAGTVTGTLTAESGAALNFASGQTMNAGTLVFNSGATLTFALTNTPAGAPLLSLGTLTQGTGGLNYNIDVTGESGAAAGTTFDLINFTTNDPFTSGSSFTLGGSSASDGTLVLTGNQVDFVINSPIPAPEPGTWAMLLGGMALLVIYQRRRRSN